MVSYVKYRLFQPSQLAVCRIPSVFHSANAHKIFEPPVVFQGALERCERGSTDGDILAFINGLEARLKLIDGGNHVATHIHHMGIRYACSALSEPSLRHHLQSYLAAGGKTLGLYESLALVERLLSALQTLSFQDPKRDVSGLFRLVTGEAGPDSPSLHRILFWARNDVSPMSVGGYLSLLVKTKDDTVRHKIWSEYLQRTVRNRTPIFREYQSAYVYAMSLVDAGDSPGAVSALKQVSVLARNDLPGISHFERVRDLLEDDAINEVLSQIVSEREYAKILDIKLGDIEQRLGITWLDDLDPDESLHLGLSDNRAASDQPIFDMDGDSSGYESPERLVAEIRAHGNSKSIVDHCKIADLLDDYEGSLIPISIESWPTSDTKFYWAPQRSPLELGKAISVSDCSQDVLLSKVGLARVIASKEENPYALVQTLHLIQLGYLLAERPRSSEHSSEVSPQLEETGYLVAWDRAYARMLVVFAGTCRGPVGAAVEFGDISEPSAFRAIARVEPLNNAWAVGPKTRIFRYRLEQDPSPDLFLNTQT
ncbi:uncharacterized protein BDW70DRAFT_148159 [Aspergillus foveolatus]|uniref:uncharacterized protein n=1 Tax=Aspergillus foveolatus TaxID=210207 RepID=UPI003CCD0E73